MRSARVWICFGLGLILFYRAEAKFIPIETQQVPIARVLSNLQKRLAQDTNDFKVTYYLARVHSMAYSTNLADVPVRKDENVPMFNHPSYDPGVPQSVPVFATPAARKAALNHLTNAIALYDRAVVLLQQSTNASERAGLILPTQLGLAWCLEQAGRTNDALAMYRKALRAAWRLEVTGGFDFNQWVNDSWSEVQTNRNQLQLRPRGHRGPGVCFSEEIIGYLLNLLNPVTDASEIARLKADQQTLNTMPRLVTPIFIPLVADARFDELVDGNANVAFDLDGSGLQRKWAWLTPKAGWLVFDPAKTGRVTSALQMFGNVTFWVFWADGYEALSALDDNGDAMLSGAELCGLAIWNDRNCNGITDRGEVIPVEALGIKSISCRSEVDAGGTRWNPKGVAFTNGVWRASYDWRVPAAGTEKDEGVGPRIPANEISLRISHSPAEE